MDWQCISGGAYRCWKRAPPVLLWDSYGRTAASLSFMQHKFIWFFSKLILNLRLFGLGETFSANEKKSKKSCQSFWRAEERARKDIGMRHRMRNYGKQMKRLYVFGKAEANFPGFRSHGLKSVRFGRLRAEILMPGAPSYPKASIKL